MNELSRFVSIHTTFPTNRYVRGTIFCNNNKKKEEQNLPMLSRETFPSLRPQRHQFPPENDTRVRPRMHSGRAAEVHARMLSKHAAINYAAVTFLLVRDLSPCSRTRPVY